MSSWTALPLSAIRPTDDDSSQWDAVIGQEEQHNASLLLSSMSKNTSVSSHAIAHETVVCGIQPSTNFVKWTTSFAPHKVCNVASNPSGTIVAVATDGATVSILRGSDGAMLATRKVASDGVRIPATLWFLSDSMLVIEPPEETAVPILVSGIRGEMLNAVDKPGQVSDAVRYMNITSLSVFVDIDFRYLRGICMTKNERGNTNNTNAGEQDEENENDGDTIIRWIVVTGEGTLTIYDYSMENKSMKVVSERISLETSLSEEASSSAEDWQVDFEVGLRIQTLEDNNSTCGATKKSYCLWSAFTRNSTKMGWLDLDSCTIVQEYTLPLSASSTKRPRILAMAPLEPCSNNNGGTGTPQSLAFAIAIRPFVDSTETFIQVFQVSVHLNPSQNVFSIGFPQQVYSIALEDSVQSLSLASLKQAPAGPFAFLCKSFYADDHQSCHVFASKSTKQDGSIIGKVRLCLEGHDFEQASTLVKETGPQVLINDKHAQFYPSEIAFCRLKYFLMQPSSNDTQNIARECLQELASGAMSGNEFGELALLKASQLLLTWPCPQDAPGTVTTISETVVGLKGMTATLNMVVKSISTDSKPRFEESMVNLKEKLAAFEYLQTIISSLDDDKLSSTKIPVNKKLAAVRSVPELFLHLVENNYFLAAEQMWNSEMQSKITTETLVSSLLSIQSTVDPRTYATFLTDVVLKTLSVNHELLPPVLTWSCKVADAFDDVDTPYSLQESIFLLEIVERACKELRVKVHSSFSSYSPFVTTKYESRNRLRSNNTSMMQTSTIMDIQSSPTETMKSSSSCVPPSPSIERPGPTLLQLGRIKGGAQKTRMIQISSLREHTIDETEENVESKLNYARALKHARSLGLDRRLVTLRTYSSCGGAHFIAKELIRHFSLQAESHQARLDMLHSQVLPFCETSEADFDKASLEYAQGLCKNKQTTTAAIKEAASIGQCCKDAETKCQVTLTTLRAALFCRYSPSWLTKLSLEAIEWASGDSSLRSELEEASRLLLIDGIVGRYCGNGAKELFHVDNPQHANRLLDFVAQHIHHESVLEDALALCDAFHHLSREQACTFLLQNTIIMGAQERSCKILELLFDKNPGLAKATFSRVILYCIATISEYTSEGRNEKAKEAVLCAIELARVALAGLYANSSGISGPSLDEEKLLKLIEDFERIHTLQKDHSIYVSLADLQDSTTLVKITTGLFEPIMQSYIDGERDKTSTAITRSRRVCSLLASSKTSRSEKGADLWYIAAGTSASCLVGQTQDGGCILQFLADLNILGGSANKFAARSCLSVALALCMKAAKQVDTVTPLEGMKNVILASSLLQDDMLLSCADGFLSKTVSIGGLSDIVGQILVRTDEGVGEQLDQYWKGVRKNVMQKHCGADLHDDSQKENIIEKSLRLRRPTLHGTWYVGDGLLLPPAEALALGIDYCKEVLKIRSSSSTKHAGLSLHYFVETRGAHALTLRLLTSSTVSQLCSKRPIVAFDAMEDANLQTSTALAERYLGGTGSGITSGVIDSQLAVSYLLRLPLKQAFKIYRSSLPTAITTRDFHRVVTLATIGKVAGSGEGLLASEIVGEPSFGWKRQHKFVAQCNLLALQGHWWGILKYYGVAFDPRRFEEEGKASTPIYAESLMYPLIEKMSDSGESSSKIIEVATKFSADFDLGSDKPFESFVEFLLSVPCTSQERTAKLSQTREPRDLRFKLKCVESTVRQLLRKIPSPFKRCHLLRSCQAKLEASECGIEYERLSTSLLLYQEQLALVLSQDLHKQEISPKPYLVEMEQVDRRRDALAILLSYFQGENNSERPSILSFFLPFHLPEDQLDSKESQKKKIAWNVIGSASEKDCVGFDPLLCFEKILWSEKNAKATAALAPICLPLGVPMGYIHARSLVIRFLKSKSGDTTFPSFEGDVLPVLNRVKASADKAELAEWCSSRYNFENEDKLKCLDLALKFAMNASSEVEKIHRSREMEREALDRVKRIHAAKDVLSDRLMVTSILRSGQADADKHSLLVDILNQLMHRLDVDVWVKEEFVPEKFVEVLLLESSELAAEYSLSKIQALSMGQFRQFSVLVHRAANSVAEKYSHIHIGSFARRLTRRWLFHGDDKTEVEAESTEVRSHRPINNGLSDLLPDIDEDDTINFVMDLNSLKDDDNTWSADIGTGAASSKSLSRLTSEEEPNSLKIDGSAREVSELASRRSALRIAFVMAHATGYHQEVSDPDSINSNENSDSTNNAESRPTAANKRKGGLLSKISSRNENQQHSVVMDHSKELIRIVFATSGSTEIFEREHTNTSFSSRSFEEHSKSNNRKAITFAMRHRALRAASILCPQEALDEVVRDEGCLANAPECNLRKCSFGAFVAKEIEELGLSLPHSDLAQLSTMHFPSYARALWQHHRDGDVRGSKGRLLLLILEMYLKDKITDFEFVVSLFEEIVRLDLPRTLLSAFEALAIYKKRFAPNQSFDSIEHNLQFLAGRIQKELEKISEAQNNTIDLNPTVETVSRLGEIMQVFTTNNVQDYLVKYIEGLVSFMSTESISDEVFEHVAWTALSVLRQVKAVEVSKQLMMKVSTNPTVLKRIFSNVALTRAISRNNISSKEEKDEEVMHDAFTASLDTLESTLSPAYL